MNRDIRMANTSQITLDAISSSIAVVTFHDNSSTVGYRVPPRTRYSTTQFLLCRKNLPNKTEDAQRISAK